MKEIDKARLKKLYEATKSNIKDKNVNEKLLIFEKQIYFDGRQYSLKIPKRVFDFIEYVKGDRIKFIVDDTEPNKSKLNLSYEKAKE